MTLGSLTPVTCLYSTSALGPCLLLFGVMITFMTISTRGFLTILTGVVMPYGAAYCLSDIHF